MKVLRFLAVLGFVVAGILLLIVPSHAALPGKAGFVPARFTVVDAGTVGKPDVVLIAGVPGSRAIYDAETGLLAPNYRLHLMQLKGAGSKLAGPNATGLILPGVVDELHRYIVAEKMHPVVVGELVALMLADAHPEDVAKIVIVDALPFYAVAFDPKATVAAVGPRATVMRNQLIAAPSFQFSMMLPDMINAMVKDEAGAKAILATTAASNRRVFADMMFEALETDVRPDIAKIETPMLVLYPYDRTLQHDVDKADALYKSAYADMPHATLVRIDGSRHFMMYDQPGKFDAALEDFLK